MYQIEQRAREQASPRAAPIEKKETRIQLHRLVGTPDPEHCEKDPVWCAADAFSTAFRNTGASLSGGDSMKSYERSTEQKQRGGFLHQFGRIAFGRGDLAAGIVRGEGTLVLVSCLKYAYRATGAQAPKTQVSAASGRQISIRGGAKISFHPGDVHSAVGLVTKSLHGARRQLLDIKRAALAKDIPETLLRAYPFLSNQKEKLLQEQYVQRLRELEITGGDPETLAVLRYGIDRLTALLHKKGQQRQEFFTCLQELVKRGQALEREYQEEGFVRRTFAAVVDATPQTDPPDSGNLTETNQPLEQQPAEWEPSEKEGLE